jgi:hypothetical protein
LARAVWIDPAARRKYRAGLYGRNSAEFFAGRILPQ